MYAVGGRTVRVQPLRHTVELSVACVTAGFTTPGVSVQLARRTARAGERDPRGSAATTTTAAAAATRTSSTSGIRIPVNGTDGGAERKAPARELAELLHIGTYAQRPELYDVVYSFKDYAAECERIEAIVAEHAPGARTLLDVACGTGKHLEQLRVSFDCEGTDIDEGLLDVARNRLPDVPLHHGDMRDLDLGRQFDVVTCLFSAIGLVGDPDGLAAAARAFTRHMRPHGLALVEPWLTPDVWMVDRPHLLTYEEPELVLARATVSGLRDERISTTEMHYVVATPAGVEHFVEHHDLYLFTTDEMRAAFGAAGLEADYDPDGLTGRGLWICAR